MGVQFCAENARWHRPGNITPLCVANFTLQPTPRVAVQLGRHAATIQSSFAAAKLNGLDQARWLAYTLDILPTRPSSKIDSVLPFANSTQP
jgi:hypothetical protein